MIELAKQAEMFANRVSKNYRNLRKWRPDSLGEAPIAGRAPSPLAPP